jgi:hypothetical protein
VSGELYELGQSDTISTVSYGHTAFNETVEDEPSNYRRSYNSQRNYEADYGHESRVTGVRTNTSSGRINEYHHRDREHDTFRNDFSMESFDENSMIQPSESPETMRKKGEKSPIKGQSLTSSVEPSPRPSSLQRFMHYFVDDSCCGKGDDHVERIDSQPNGRLRDRKYSSKEVHYDNLYPLKNRSNHYHQKEAKAAQNLEKSISEKYFEDYKRSQQCSQLCNYNPEDSAEYNRKEDRAPPTLAKTKTVKTIGLNEKNIQGTNMKEVSSKNPVSRVMREERINELVEFLSNSTLDMINEENSDISSHHMPLKSSEEISTSLNNLPPKPSIGHPSSLHDLKSHPKARSSRSSKLSKFIPYGSQEAKSSKKRIDDNYQSTLTPEKAKNIVPGGRQKVKQVKENREESSSKRRSDDSFKLPPNPEKPNKSIPCNRQEVRRAKEKRGEGSRSGSTSWSSKSSVVQRPVFLYKS